MQSITMMATSQCVECGATLPSDEANGFCPRCALGAALALPSRPPADFHPSALFDHSGEPETATAPRSFGLFGDYELLEEIARGGMGVVYKARQVSLNRTVAVKMILSGHLASKADVHRFRAEAEAAGHLQHPNIVAIHDVGEHQGQQYFSMDYIEGRDLARIISDLRSPIADFNRAARWLKTIAEAIHYAHQRGILHRDLKPSNVLIDAHDQPRITDFGLAKRFTPMLDGGFQAADLTLSGQVLGSPSFMPPEQAAGGRGRVGSYSDVYSLGAILYHLLTGRPPFVAETLTETLQQVQQTDPISPRLLHPAVPRDLETICLKCLEKETRQRYATAQALADDLGRLLSQEPVVARPVGSAGKCWRWCRRTPALASAIAACALVVILGIDGIGWQWRRAEHNAASEERQRQRAERNAANSQQVAQFLREILQGVASVTTRVHDRTELEKMLDVAAVRMGKELKDQPEVEAEVRSAIGGTYEVLGRYAEGEAMHRQALAIYRTLFTNDHPSIVLSLQKTAMALSAQGKQIEAEATLREVIAMGKRSLSNEHPVVLASLNNLSCVLLIESQLAPPLQKEKLLAEGEKLARETLALLRKRPGNEDVALANSLQTLALIFKSQGKLAEAETMSRELLAMFRKQAGGDNGVVANAMINLADTLTAERKDAEAEGLYRQALALNRRERGDEHPHVAYSLGHLFISLHNQRKLAEAETVCRESLAMYRKLLGAEYPYAIGTLSGLANLLLDQGKLPEAEAACREALALNRKVFGEEGTSTGGARLSLATALIRQNKAAEAEGLAREALARCSNSSAGNPERFADSSAALANILRHQRKLAQAEPLNREALAYARQVGTNDPLRLRNAIRDLASVLPEQSSLAEVEILDREVVAMDRNLWPSDPGKWEGDLHQLAFVLRSQKRYSEAEAVLMESNGQLEQCKTADRVFQREAIECLVQLYEAWDADAPSSGKSALAEQWQKKLLAFKDGCD